MGEDEGEVLERGEVGVEFLEIFILFGALDADVVGVFGVETGLFGGMMKVELVNDGPVTIILRSGD